MRRVATPPRSVNTTAPCCLAAAALLLAGTAQAQSGACEQFKGALAARIDPGIRAFTLETVPADTPVPPGAKVIGTCDAGAFKILLRRGAAAPASAAPVVAAAPRPARRASAAASAPAAPVAERETTRPTTASVTELVRSTEPAVAAAPAPSPAVAVPASAAPAAAEPGFLRRHWPWVLALVLLPLAGWAWAWIAHRRAYDDAGLPRGPRLD